MHIPDNYLSPQTDAVMAVAMVPVWVHCIKKVRATLDRKHMAFLGICAAFSFLLMMFNVPLPGGTTGHAVGGALIAHGIYMTFLEMMINIAFSEKTVLQLNWSYFPLFGCFILGMGLIIIAINKPMHSQHPLSSF